MSYPTSCSPQAWAAAAPLLLLRAILRLEPDAGEGVLHIAPALPAWLRNLRIDGIRVRDGLVSVRVFRPFRLNQIAVGLVILLLPVTAVLIERRRVGIA